MIQYCKNEFLCVGIGFKFLKLVENQESEFQAPEVGVKLAKIVVFEVYYKTNFRFGELFPKISTIIFNLRELPFIGLKILRTDIKICNIE